MSEQHTGDIKPATEAPTTDQGSSPTGIAHSVLPSTYMQQKPVSILVGAERKRYFIFKDLLSAKSPYFAARFKECWDGKKDEVELCDAGEEEFEVVMDWMHPDKLPTRLTLYNEDLYNWTLSSRTYKLADRLIIPKLQDELLTAEFAKLRKSGLWWGLGRLIYLQDLGLAHTPYYSFYLKAAVWAFMTGRRYVRAERHEEVILSLKDHGQVAVDVLLSIRKWNDKAWGDLCEGDLKAFMVERAPPGPKDTAPSATET
ncbi:hypothetical protein LTR70_000867 [Exophiala xenobiotica]|uniref:BTB domain-containing protein n=1 Tax=Lithohypha guttulata TaxID=1690604 RepID=A0ABR0KK96_9EURO|nr:hypothetical protein LTR24_001639 [Lithohypha guttulata]KAK5329031.1 hypothetical protein LTR70_000867 [Exophiala xenobiotica]